MTNKEKIERMRHQIREIRKDIESDERVIERQYNILTEIARVVKGEPYCFQWHSHHDLAAAAQERIDNLERKVVAFGDTLADEILSYPIDSESSKALLRLRKRLNEEVRG